MPPSVAFICSQNKPRDVMSPSEVVDLESAA